MSGLPMLVEGMRLRVLVVGGGAVAARRARRFVGAGATVRVTAPELCDELETLVREHEIAVVRRPYQADDLADAQVVVAATSDPKVNAQVARDCDAQHRLLNAADFSTDGNLSMMAAHESGPMTIAVTAGGVPAAAVRIRDAIAERFDGRYGVALEALAAERSRLVAAGESALWQARSAEVIDEGFCEAVENDSLAGRIAGWR